MAPVDPIGSTVLEPSPNGPAWAALVAAGAGAMAFGALTDASECSARASAALLWYRPAGSLSGVAATAVIAWAMVWVALHAAWRHKQFQSQRALLVVTLLLALAAVVATFPPFYELLGG